MGVLRVQHCFQGPSGEAVDTYCNVFHLKHISELLVSGDGPTIATAIKAFYSALSLSTINIHSSVVEHAGASIKMYNLADAKPRVVAYEEFYTPSFSQGSSTDNLPNEVAICLSYNAEPQEGAVRARNRGRIYLGPLNVKAIASSATEDPTVESGLRTAIINAAKALRTAMYTISDQYVWSIYSPATAATNGDTGTDDLATFPIFNFSVDNAFDTQRRRGTLASARTVSGL